MPLIFCDDKKIFNKFLKTHVVHSKGFFILAPSGSGKTYFVKKQTKKHWIDGDIFWTATKAQPNGPWWTKGLEVINEIDQRCDVMTQQAKKLGLWIVGASNYWLIPDAIVIPDWKTNKKYIIEREKKHYDGGAKSSDFKQVLGHRRYLAKLAKKQKIPVFKSVQDAAYFLEKKIFNI